MSKNREDSPRRKIVPFCYQLNEANKSLLNEKLSMIKRRYNKCKPFKLL